MSFPSPAQDYRQERIDLSKELVQHPDATFYMRAKGDGMKGANIPDGAILVVDRSIKATSDMIIVGVLNGEFIVRRLVKVPRAYVLHADASAEKPITITKDLDFRIWGVVTAIVIQPLR